MPKKEKSKSTNDSLLMKDILFGDQIYWERIKQVVKNLADAYGFYRLDMPLLEKEELFTAGGLTSTDVLKKRICSLKTAKGDDLSLCSEFTPVIARAYLDNDLSQLVNPVKIYSAGPLFQYSDNEEKLNQFYQAKFEIIGEKDAVVDAQLAQLFFSLSRDLGLKDLIIQINSMGCAVCRPDYQKLLLSFYKKKIDSLCNDCCNNLQQNIFKTLSCPKEKCCLAAENAPQFIDYLCNDCHNHFRNVLEFLDELEIPYILNPRLFRDFDYYTKTVFDVFWENKQNVENVIARAGRHDNLISFFKGADTPAVGIDVYLNQMADLMKENNVKISQKERPLIFLVQLGDLGKKKSLVLFEKLRTAGLRVANTVDRNTVESQFKMASALGARFVLILGQKEALDETIIIRDIFLKDQEIIPVNKLIKELKKRIKETKNIG